MPQFLIKYWPLIHLVVTLFAAWVCWSLRQMAKNAIDAAVLKLTNRLDDQSGLISGHDTRINRTELQVAELAKDIGNLPTVADITRLEGKIEGVDRELSGVGRGVDRIEKLFLQRGVDA